MIINIKSPTPHLGPHGKPLRVVVVDCAYDVMDHPEIQSLFPKILAMKIEGYRTEYPYGVLPVDTGDFVGWHIAICEERDTGLTPLMGFKSINLERCETFHFDFPAFHLTEGENLIPYKTAITNCIARAKSEKQSIGYNGSWAITPEVRNNRPLARLIKDMSISFLARFYQTYKIKYVLAAGAVRFKVDDLKRFIGFKPIELNGESLESFETPAFFGEKISLMFLENFSPEINQLADGFQALWDHRIVLSKETLDLTQYRKVA